MPHESLAQMIGADVKRRVERLPKELLLLVPPNKAIPAALQGVLRPVISPVIVLQLSSAVALCELSDSLIALVAGLVSSITCYYNDYAA